MARAAATAEADDSDAQLIDRAQAMLGQWVALSDCTLIARGGMEFRLCKIYLARHSRVLA